MDEQALRRVMTRLEHVERENRRLKRIGYGILLGVAAAVLMGQAMPARPGRVVEAQRFVIRDHAGTTRAALGLAPDGSTGLAVADQLGRLRAALTVGADGAPTLGLFDHEEKNRAALVVGADGAPSLALFDRSGKSRAGLAVGPDGSPEVVFNRL